MSLVAHAKSISSQRPALGEGTLDLLPRHAVDQHCQWVAQIDHLIEAVAEKMSSVMALLSKLPENRLH